MRVRRTDAGYMLLVVLIFAILMTAFGAVLLHPTQSALLASRDLEAELAARQGARSALELALDDVVAGKTNEKAEGELGEVRYSYRIEPVDSALLRIRISATTGASRHKVEAVLETTVRPPQGAGLPVSESWRLYTKRAR